MLGLLSEQLKDDKERLNWITLFVRKFPPMSGNSETDAIAFRAVVCLCRLITSQYVLAGTFV